MTQTSQIRSERLASLDVFRGLVILLLVSDPIGAFSLYAMANRYPEEPIWGLIAPMFQHVRWLGMSFWDLVLPAFVLAAGIALSYSISARQARGDSDGLIVAHLILRGFALLALHLTLSVPVKSYLDFLWPLAILALGLQLPRRAAGLVPRWRWLASWSAELIWWTLILSVVTLRATMRFNEIGSFELFTVFPSLGLACLMVAPVILRSWQVQASTAAILLLAYWLAFALYPVPAGEVDPTSVGVTSPDERFNGFMAHWSKGTHAAAAFDVWLLNLFPRALPYYPPEHGFHTLRFVPISALLLLGVLIGRALRGAHHLEQARDRLALAAAASILLGLGLGMSVEPVINRVWTVSWTLLSGGVVLMAFLALYSVIEIRGHNVWTPPFVAAGVNSLAIFLLALEFRWPILATWRYAFGGTVFDGYGQPIAESLAILITLWLLAALLHRLRLVIRL